MSSLEEKFNNIGSLSRRERQQLVADLNLAQPKFFQPYIPWWKKPLYNCTVDVLIVADGGLNFGVGGGGLSEFLTIFRDLHLSPRKYKLTLAHRGGSNQFVPGSLNNPILSSNKQLVVDTLTNFKFDATGVNLSSYDQVWLFGIDSAGDIDSTEVAAINQYMDNGGGLFATGDHGSLGSAMCGAIQRVKDMRHWGPHPNMTELESMRGSYRNDTNQAPAGASSSMVFAHQSDNLPQTIYPLLFANNQPHPLLSISTAVVPSGMITIMPDHPHEGQCKPVTSFDGISTQMVALSLVPGGNTAGTKDPTVPHVFNSIAVWDGRGVGKGRIVVDSTWHHFVDINLNGYSVTPPYNGLDTSDLNIIKQYFKNIARWMNRKPSIFCALYSDNTVFKLAFDNKLVESTLEEPRQRLKEVSLADLNAIGVLAEQTLKEDFTPAMSRIILLEWMAQRFPEFAEKRNAWNPPSTKKERKEKASIKGYYQEWIDMDLILHTTIGAGFMAMYADERFKGRELKEDDSAELFEVFLNGLKYGYEMAVKDFRNQVENISKFL